MNFFFFFLFHFISPLGARDVISLSDRKKQDKLKSIRDKNKPITAVFNEFPGEENQTDFCLSGLSDPYHEESFSRDLNSRFAAFLSCPVGKDFRKREKRSG